jgi:mannose-6-phosphate isomerase
MKFTAKKVLKPWGHELWWAQTKAYLGKILVVNKGHRLSLQYHKRKRETLHVLRGVLLLEHQGKKLKLRPGNSFDIAPGQTHRFAAPFGRVTLLEVSTPEAHDIVRLSDDYGRG